MIVDLGTQLLFLDDGLLLVFARLALLECRLVLELAVVHDLADRRSGVGSYFDKVEIGIRGDAEGVFDAHNAYLLATWSDQADFWYTNALVDAGLSADGASYVGSAEETPPICISALTNRKALLEAGPNADRSRLAPPAPPTVGAQNRRPRTPATGPLYLVANGGSGTPLAVPDMSRDGRA
ncbi:uncharacterized protein RMCFA_4347 [Mycolicibacterium fortuitum subsp. acetamidolyticum]|uniref:Uncharacterized protein n=1 Tax=Mycolicibacterium fortuitum subsp. acetamidolyticum TaxID=144550 RepID=A0A117IFG2_MYCFO|nr:hypothetical protein MFTT_34910 [Mycolicibacterium fortuitum subsp. fortuitum]GAT04236.1 uncharacterized protein RMCFA_4347 [Mycolicibacterium fortuitum subsp. acetamidolyticum]